MSIYIALLEKGEFQSQVTNKTTEKNPTATEKSRQVAREKFDSSSRTVVEKLNLTVPRQKSKMNSRDLPANSLETESSGLPDMKSSWEEILSGTDVQLKPMDLPDKKDDLLKADESERQLNLPEISESSKRNPEAKQDVPVEARSPQVDQNQDSVVPLPMRKLRLRGMVTPNMEHRGIVEEFRHIKRLLAKNVAKSDGEMGAGVVITSALPGEGKTFTALNLIMSLSMEKTRKVLLVDADMEKGGATDFLELNHHRGLRDYLEDDSLSLDDVMVQTNQKNLRIIPRGIAQTHSAEVFSTKRMESLIESLSYSSQFDMVVFDAPPALISSSANILSGLVDQTLVVVQANETSGNHIREVEENLIDCRSMGFVLNRAAYSEKKHNIYYAQSN